MTKPVVTIARYQDRIVTDKTPEEAATIHGPGAIFVDGRAYTEILAEEQAAVEVPVAKKSRGKKGEVTE